MQIHRGDNAYGMLVLAAILGAFVCSGAQGALDACSALASAALPAGASVVSATLEPATGSGATAKPEHCKVLVAIAPRDPGAQPINVQVNLPSAWNEKAVQMGGGGYDGYLVTADGNGPGASAQATPLASGYATFGSDGGHSVANPFDVEAQVTAFLNDEVLLNYAGAQLKKTHDLAIALIRLRYGKAPRRLYFLGGSTVGRDALNVMQKWGADYDGAVAYYPAAGGVPLVIELGRASRALAAPGAYPNPAKQALLHSAVVAACDAADGVVDGVVSNPTRCTFNVTSLRCANGTDEGDACLSDAQIAALKVMGTDLQLNYPLASGQTGIARYNVFQGVDLTARVSGLGSAAPSPMPLAPGQPIHEKFYDIFVRGWLLRDPHADSLAFDPEKPGTHERRMSDLSSVLDVSQPDLSEFQRHGGKLILVHGNDDSLIPVGWSEDYYKSVVKEMGAATVDGFVRFYTVPGYGHGVGTFTVDWDSLSALDHWVENGAAPADPIATDVNPANRGRTRPLCRYPTWPKYNGSGDIDSAANFSCAP